MPLRLLAGLAGGVALAAFALGAARLGGSGAPAQPAAAPAPAPRGPEAPPAPAPVLAIAPAPAAKATPVLAALPPSPSPAARGRVAAGVLARAASLRAQEREAACPAPEATGRDGAAAPAGPIESLEIDWNAAPQQP